MDKPQRKRSRVETTPRRVGKRKSSGSAGANRTPGSGGNEAKIVWKDSPADKQIRVSGTGKMAVRREMQGFVGRLARASQHSPPCTQEEETQKTRERSRTKRKAGMALQYEDHTTSRHLLFSPESRRPGEEQTLPSPGTRRLRSTPEKLDSQEDLFSVLDKTCVDGAEICQSRCGYLYSGAKNSFYPASTAIYNGGGEPDSSIDSISQLLVDWDPLATLIENTRGDTTTRYCDTTSQESDAATRDGDTIT
ncbi:Tripartite DNA replication factor [Phytophthora boehmeriae]|uniref:Tripartite DNA replication factor n=1 Tax=Phytophthora boehmeriae TaxID=109152 RepID=A0A8T1WTH2_9STRA|nr:Tripartite DNA replication factor [Phytophthora boehmeriae]